MTDLVEPLDAKAKLAVSRAQLLAAMGYEQVQRDVTQPAEVAKLEAAVAVRGRLGAGQHAVATKEVGKVGARSLVGAHAEQGEDVGCNRHDPRPIDRRRLRETEAGTCDLPLSCAPVALGVERQGTQLQIVKS